MLGRAALAALAVLLLTSGSLGAPAARDEVPFDAVQRAHFDALTAVRESGAPSDAPLVLRVRVLGDAADSDLAAPFAWLSERANVRVERADDGAPLYLTRLDLSATSGRATLGATIPTGMAVEMTDARVAPCVVAHEMLHFLGLTHVGDAKNIMSPQCTPGKLDRATFAPEQRARIDALRDVRASTALGSVTWATRG